MDQAQGTSFAKRNRLAKFASYANSTTLGLSIFQSKLARKSFSTCISSCRRYPYLFATFQDCKSHHGTSSNCACQLAWRSSTKQFWTGTWASKTLLASCCTTKRVSSRSDHLVQSLSEWPISVFGLYLSTFRGDRPLELAPNEVSQRDWRYLYIW